ncbi:MAG: hypothetical protein Q4A67_04950 [Aerococcus sp.]|nr:hypothetical protein [Aerococcus sp.]
MGFLDRLFSHPKRAAMTPRREEKAKPEVAVPTEEDASNVFYDTAMSEEERDLVAAIAGAAVANAALDSHWHIKSIKKMDMDALAAVLCASAAIAGDDPNKQVVVKRVTRLQ